MRRLFALALLLLASLAFAQNRDPFQLQAPAVDDVLRTLSQARNFSQVAISPDASKVAWVQSLRREGERGNAIFVADLRSPGKPRRITAATGDTGAYESQIAWSPDSRQIAFLSDAAKSGQQQLYVGDVDKC